MPLCIYCYQQLNSNNPPDDMTSTREHVVPWALGGSNQFSTHEASKKYNNDFGRDIDAPFIDLLPLAIKRHQLGIEGYSGTIPPIRWKARSLDNDEPIEISIAPDGQVSYRHDTVVIKDEKATHSNVLVGADRERTREILAGMLAKARKSGQSIYSATGDPIRTVTDMERHYTIEETSLMRADVKALDFDVWVRGIFKMILGLGHIVLGSTWTFGVDGNRFRAVLAEDRKHWPTESLRGFATGEIPDDIAGLLGITPAVRQARMHTLAILPGEEPMAIVSLFGGDGVPEAMIATGAEQGALAVVNDTMKRTTRVGARIDPRTRQVTWITIGDLDIAAASLEKTE